MGFFYEAQANYHTLDILLPQPPKGQLTGVCYQAWQANCAVPWHFKYFNNSVLL